MPPRALLLVVALLISIAAAAPAASAAAKPCPRGTVASRATGKPPRGMKLLRCVPKLRSASTPSGADAAKLLTSRAVLGRVPKRAPRFRAAVVRPLAALLAKVRNPFVLGEAPPANARPVSGRRAGARAAAAAPAVSVDLGQIQPGVHGTATAKLNGGKVADATLRAEDEHGNAFELTVSAASDPTDTGECPTADGRIHRTLPLHVASAAEVSLHGKTTRVEVRLAVDVDYSAQVGDNAKLSTLAALATGSVELATEVRLTATGKLLEHAPTRVYRASWGFGGPWTGTAPEIDGALFRQVRVFTPSSSAFDAATEMQHAFRAMGYTAGGAIAVVQILADMQHHWYDDEACLTLDLGGMPSPAQEGGKVEYSPNLMTLKGDRPRAHYDASTGCPGQLDRANADFAGGFDAAAPTFTITDTATEWRTVRGPCLTVVALSPAGKKTARTETPVQRLAVPLFHLHATIKTVYDCGGEATPLVMDDATLDGDVTGRDPEDERVAVGTGTIGGTTTTVFGGCDQFDTTTLSAVPVKLSAQYASDGTLAISWVPDQAALRWAQLGFLHPGSGTKVDERDQPDGNTGNFHTTITVTVSGLHALTE